MSLEKDGMPDRVYPCEVGMACKGYYENGGDYECEWLESQVVDFGVIGKMPVYWCQSDVEKDNIVELMTEIEANGAR